jgi:hypothetical protein
MLGYSRFSHRHSSPDACWSERTTLSGDTGASTRSPRNIEISAKIPVPDLWGQCQHTDWIALRWAILGSPLGPSGTAAGGCEWGTVHPCPLVPHSLSYSASHRHFTTFGLWSRVGHRSARLVPHSLTQRSLV